MTVLPASAGTNEVPVPGQPDWERVREFFRTHDREHLVYIKKNSFTLFVVDDSFNILYHARIAYGSNPDRGPKVYTADRRTPEGLYRIIEVMHMGLPEDHPKYKAIKRMNSVYFRARDGHAFWGHPNRDLGKGVYGFGFFRLDYPNEQDKERYEHELEAGRIPENPDGSVRGYGSGIGIHGTNDPDSLGHLATTGCVRVHNEDLKELVPYLYRGDYVLISR